MDPLYGRMNSPYQARKESIGRAPSVLDQTQQDEMRAANASRPGGDNNRVRKKFVLCFDGTGNKFAGTDADSNILKIYRMLDRNDGAQFHYYQPGIGTYVNTSSLNHSSTVQRIRSAYMKAKDSAVGTSFAEHVMAGYRFLMRYYLPGDDIFFFGFSRGAYTARFLAEMLDHVGLLTAGNEEMCRFAWKTFQKWQQRTDKTDKEREEKKKLLEFMCAFRETFSRPVRRIRFMGLFDTVNSVPSFENAWMQRSKFPYTARSTAKVIRHAVAIDERRAKFRQDLIGQSSHTPTQHRHHHYWRHSRGAAKPGNTLHPDQIDRGRPLTADSAPAATHRYQPSRSRAGSTNPPGGHLGPPMPENFRDPSETAGVRNLLPDIPQQDDDDDGNASAFSVSRSSLAAIRQIIDDDDDSDSDAEGGATSQDIEELWFPGCHADIGGGWPIEDGVDSALSHVPLVWMVREAQRAGLIFDQQKLRHLNCHPDDETMIDENGTQDKNTTEDVPQIAIQSPSPITSPGPSRRPTESISDTLNKDVEKEREDEESDQAEPPLSPFHRSIHSAATKGRIHDVLQFNNGIPHLSVAVWNFMEYLPFRRMDLQDDGSWKSISWPLPKGEVRDIPDDAKIHNSVIRRMKANEDYRPGNLIVGGGGRGVRKAPKEYGMGKWNVLREEGSVVGEVYVRASPPARQGSSPNGLSKLLKKGEKSG